MAHRLRPRAGRHAWRLGLSAKARLTLIAGSGALALALSILAARRFADTPWPLSRGDPGLLTAAGLLFLVAYALKIYAWRWLFAVDERPQTRALAAATGGASIVGLVLPGRCADVVRIAIVNRYPGCPAGVRTLCLSIVVLGLIDIAALAPLALALAVRARLLERRAHRPDPSCRGWIRSRRLRRSAAAIGHTRAARALAARPLARAAHDLAASCFGSMGARLCLLARPDSRTAAPSRSARGRLLVRARRPLPLGRRGSRGAAEAPQARPRPAPAPRRSSPRVSGPRRRSTSRWPARHWGCCAGSRSSSTRPLGMFAPDSRRLGLRHDRSCTSRATSSRSTLVLP